MSRTIRQQLVTYLIGAHSIEEQALAQLRTAPRIAEDPELAALFSVHLAETERQEALVRERLEQLGGSTSPVKDALMAIRKGLCPVRPLAAGHARQACHARVLLRAPRASRLRDARTRCKPRR